MTDAIKLTFESCADDKCPVKELARAALRECEELKTEIHRLTMERRALLQDVERLSIALEVQR